MKKIHIIGGGTNFHVRPHFALSAPAYGALARQIASTCYRYFEDYEIRKHLTKMADPEFSALDTNNDISNFVDTLIQDVDTKVIFMTAALCNYEGFILNGDGNSSPSGKNQHKLISAGCNELMRLELAPKILSKIRQHRKDIFLVACKTTSKATEDEMFTAGISLLKKNHCNLVLVNDVSTRLNMIVVPEVSRYCVTSDRCRVVNELVEMASLRSNLTFHPTNVVPGELLAWDKAPTALKAVVDYCIDRGAYRAHNDITVGHFGFKVEENCLYSSCRKKNFNRVEDKDLVRLVLSNETISAFGAKPSAGARSQHLVLSAYPEYDCIVHFHCPKKPKSNVSVRSQRAFECGSLECGVNTAQGIMQYDRVGAVMLDQHGPNIVFSSHTDPNVVIKFIEENFDLSSSTSVG